MQLVYSFLKDLISNNERAWLHENQAQYEQAKAEFKSLVRMIEDLLMEHDKIDTSATKIYRIPRDVRFSKNKTPYNTAFRASFKRAGEERRGGYFLRLEPDNSRIVGGFFGPDPADLLHIRRQLQQDHEELRRITAEEKFQEYFGSVVGASVKTAPRGFKKDDPAIDFLQLKQFLAIHSYTDAEVLSLEFPQMVNEGYRKLRRFFDFMSILLTTDLNGESILRNQNL